SPSRMEDEHRLLGEVMLVLLRNKTIPDDLLEGYLVGRTPEISTSVLQSGHLQSIAEFWQALGGKPKAALNYTVTISIEPDAPSEAPVVGRSGIGGQMNPDPESVP
ncbi:MAG: Pvc16 family protein, partial [Chloroflexota bacterium]